MNRYLIGQFEQKRAQKGELTFLAFFCLALLSAVAIQSGIAPHAFATDRPFRVAFSSNLFSEVNETDARAAMKAWITSVAKERAIPVDPNLHIFHTVEEMVKLEHDHAVDGFGIVTPEYFVLSKYFKFDRVALGINKGQFTEEYCLVVRSDSGIERVHQLKGRSISVLKNPQMSLALIWLDTVLMKAKMKPSANFFGSITENNNIQQVVLPVFFGKIDACLVSKRRLEVMGELNPQINKQLRIIEISPPFIPSGFVFRADYKSSFRAQILDSMKELANSVSGRQILTLTQTEKFDHYPITYLDSSLELVAEHRQLLGKTGVSAAGSKKGK